MRHLFFPSALTLALCAPLLAGPLTPPAGPVTSTHKALTEVEPRIPINATNTPGDADSLFKITQPGSYYLTGNITGVVGKNGIEIAAGNVTIDLNGFGLNGVPGSLSGITTGLSAFDNLTIRNGSITSWGSDGLNIGQTGADRGARIDEISASSNAGFGIAVGSNAVIRNCSANSNGAAGVLAFFDTVITHCAASENGTYGISATNGCTVVHCAASGNATAGIFVSSGANVSYCTVDTNLGAGISATSACAISACTARFNTLDGILCSSSCVVRGNTCHNNGQGAGVGAGVRASGPGNRIESNNCTGADFGVKVDASGNFIAANLCSGNTTNWNIATTNRCLVINSASAGAIAGNSGGVSPGSTDPNANYTY